MPADSRPVPAPAASFPADVRRALVALVGLALAAVFLTSVYADPGHYDTSLGAGLPDIGVPSGVIVQSMMVLSAMMMAWALLVSVLASPGGARAAYAGTGALLRAEARTRWTWAAAVALASAYAYVHLATGQQHQYASVVQYTAGEAATPFQYRALVPWVAAALRALPHVADVPYRVLYGVLDGLAAVGVWLAVRRFLGPYVGAPGAAGRPARAVAALAAFVPLALGTAAPWRHNDFYFPYDTLAVATFALGLALLQERRWLAYYALFAVATLNRETTCFLTIAYVLANLGRAPLHRLALHAGAQLVIWVGLKAGLAALYAGNPVLNNVGNGLFIVTTMRTTLSLVAVPAWVYTALALGGTWVVLALLRRRLREPQLRRWFRFVPVFLVGMALVGELLEVRIYGELIPLVTAGLLLVFADLVREALDDGEADGTASAWIARPRSLRAPHRSVIANAAPAPPALEAS